MTSDDRQPSARGRPSGHPAWRGYFPAIVTPFNRDFSVDEAGLRVLVRSLVHEGMHGIVVAGTTGEWPSLTPAERSRVFEVARDATPAETPLIAGCSAINLQETLEHMRVSESLGYDGILVSIPPYLDPTEEEVVEFYEIVARNTRLPLIVYNWPPGTGRDLHPELLQRLARIERVVAIKNSTSDPEAFEQTLRRLGDQVLIFGIMPGDRGLDMLRTVGGHGCIGASGALGRVQPEFFDAAWRGDDQRALACGRIDQAFMAEHFRGYRGRYGHALATIKEMLRIRGLPAGPVRPPLRELDGVAKARLREFARAHRLLDGDP